MTDISTLRRNGSHQTIQSDNRGQFGNLWRHVQRLNSYPQILIDFQAKTSNYERIRYALPFLECVKLVPIFRLKDSTLAESNRLKGNEYFKKKDFANAMRLYNTSILNAQHELDPDKTLSLAVANRSACWHHMNEPEMVIRDIQYAIAMGYPDKQKYKLYLRLAKAQRNLGQTTKALTSLMIAKSTLTATEEGNIKEAALKQIQHDQEEIKADTTRPVLQGPGANTLHPPSAGKEAEGRIRVEFDPNLGRHVVAAADLQVGDLLLQESPYASALYPEQFGSHCQECLHPLKAFIPCRTCSGVAFCSAECAQKGEVYHRVECQFAEALRGFGCSQVARLALRMISQRKFDDVMALKMQLQSFKTDQETPADLDPYVQAYNLSGNDEQREADDQLERALMACLLLQTLEKGGYFPPHFSDFEYVFIGSLLLRNLQVLQFNAHEVYEILRPDRVSLTPSKSHQIALAIYPRASYFNHSCHGEVGRFFNGKTMGLRVLRPIKKGQEIHDNYGPTFYLKAFNERRRELDARYWFQCGCTACLENWPLLARLPKSEPRQEVEKAFQSGCEHIKNGQVESAIRDFAVVLHQECQLSEMRMPSQGYIKAEDKIRTCISNYGKAVFIDKMLK
ncbi:hypothetical protein TCAL_01669, partial [Tigriopus californicus]|eukprot:TCALIF_01669-PA protein Name:"Similar to SMYD4 SET and MYND domain-containing protein 4 (Pongo abelii)" AED:0.02 eAED:0.02 QI:66/1/0.66/1/1/0.66/3/0/622